MSGKSQQRTASELLDHMFAVEMAFLGSGGNDVGLLATAFHPEVVIHEPDSLPYRGEWRRLDGVGALFQAMRATWRDLRVEDLQSARLGDTVFMGCRLHLTARCNGVAIEQPFAEVLRFENDLLVEGTPFYHDTAALNSALALAPQDGT